MGCGRPHCCLGSSVPLWLGTGTCGRGDEGPGFPVRGGQRTRLRIWGWGPPRTAVPGPGSQRLMGLSASPAPWSLLCLLLARDSRPVACTPRFFPPTAARMQGSHTLPRCQPLPSSADSIWAASSRKPPMMLALTPVSPCKQVSLGKLPTSQPCSDSCKFLHPKNRRRSPGWHLGPQDQLTPLAPEDTPHTH